MVVDGRNGFVFRFRCQCIRHVYILLKKWELFVRIKFEKKDNRNRIENERNHQKKKIQKIGKMLHGTTKMEW